MIPGVRRDLYNTLDGVREVVAEGMEERLDEGAAKRESLAAAKDTTAAARERAAAAKQHYQRMIEENKELAGKIDELMKIRASQNETEDRLTRKLDGIIKERKLHPVNPSYLAPGSLENLAAAGEHIAMQHHLGRPPTDTSSRFERSFKR